MDIEEIIKALANPVRRDILVWLKDPISNFPSQTDSLDVGVCAGQIDRRAGLSQSTISSHLATLQRAGLVESGRVGQRIFFKRNEKAIQAFLDEMNQQL
jgi:ArsR family transcriptional regulator